jgi:hypothetical protein
MSNLLLIGDSGTLALRNIPPAFVYSGVPTALDFIKQIEKPNSELSRFLKSHQSRARYAVLSLGGLDIRAHWWKHIPETGISPEAYIQKRVEDFYQSLKKTADLYGLEKIVIWGAPPAIQDVQFVPQYPYYGSAITRNIIKHIFSRSFNNCIHRDLDETRIGQATRFYEYIMPDYQATPDVPLGDKVHYSFDVKDLLWKTLDPVVFGDLKIYTGNTFDQMQADRFEISSTIVDRTALYNTWILGKDIRSPSKYSRKVHILEDDYHLVNNADTKDAGNRYTELGLSVI